MATESIRPTQRQAGFAVISRLLSCLITERLLRAFYVGLVDTSRAVGIVVILSTHLTPGPPIIDRGLHAHDIFAIVPVHHPPIFSGTPSSKHGQLVGLLDPLDMLPETYELDGNFTTACQDGFKNVILNSLTAPGWELGRSENLIQCFDPVQLWRKFVEPTALPERVRETIGKELQSSYEWQLIAYDNPPRCPDWNSSRIEWEQSLVTGHPTHPMHRARMTPAEIAKYDWYRPRIRFAAVPRPSLDILGPFECIVRRLAEKIANKSNRTLPDEGLFVIMPIHELQVKNILVRVPNLEILHPDITVEALAQSSIRTIFIPDLPNMTIKLSVGITISSAQRTVSHFTANFGPRFSEMITSLTFDRDILTVEREPASAVYHSPDPDISKHFSVILREEYQPPPNEKVIVCAALLEMDHLGSPLGVAAVQHTLQLNSKAKRVRFLDQYIRTACCAVLPTLIRNGVAFEAHAQNMLVRFNSHTKDVLGFVIRDLGGLRIHPATLRHSTGIDFQFLPGHCVATETLEEIFPKLYHSFVHNHLQRLIRVLDLHYNGIGWELLRKHLKEVIPIGHALKKAWLDPAITEVPSKCLMRMRMRDSYRDVGYCHCYREHSQK
ncbi:hypothetical protein AX15_001463 [Amanita polypyramis BW_CC]|nr:hypothetical protein AX15_001463 [Amanita polypyramis BW_CC]